MVTPHAGLELDDDPSFQRRIWIIERGAWVLFAMCLLCAFAGLTGQGGLLARATETALGANVEYPRVARWQASDKITIRIPSRTTGEVEITLSPSLVEAFEWSSMQPSPSDVAISNESVVYRVPAINGGAVQLFGRANIALGAVRGEVTVNEATLPVSILVLP